MDVQDGDPKLDKLIPHASHGAGLGLRRQRTWPGPAPPYDEAATLAELYRRGGEPSQEHLHE